MNCVRLAVKSSWWGRGCVYVCPCVYWAIYLALEKERSLPLLSLCRLPVMCSASRLNPYLIINLRSFPSTFAERCSGLAGDFV